MVVFLPVHVVAAITAVLVVNVDDGGLGVWLGPTVVVCPLISWWIWRMESSGGLPPARQTA